MDKPTKTSAITSDTSVKEVKKIILELEAIVEESQDAIIGKLVDGTIVSWNGGATKMFGYSREEMIGKSIADLFSPENQNELSGLLDRIKKGEAISNYDSIWIKKDGTKADVEFSLSPIHAKEGLVIGSSLIGRDITERRKADVDMKKSIEKFKVYMDMAPIGIFVSDELGNYLDANPMALKISGYSMEELLKISIKDFLTTEYVGIGLKVFNEVKTNNYANAELMVHRKNNEIFWINLVTAKIDDKHFIAFCEDITNRKKLEVKFKDKFSEMEKLYSLMIGRELKMAQQKTEIGKLKDEAEKNKI